MPVHIKEPKKPVPAGYRPTGGEPHRVTDRDDWWKLAATRGVDPWWLIQYNFETRDAGEVNWYLQNRVGCQKTTQDGKNFVFSAAADPGIIYLPSPQLARTLKSMAYGRFGIVIEGDQDYQAQVRATLDYLARSDTGMVLLNAIKRTGKEIVISPYTGTDCNANAIETDRAAATPKGEDVLMGGSSFEQMKEPSWLRDALDLPHDTVQGTGAGSNSNVHFSPAMFGYGSTGPCASLAGMPGASPSQALFHELSHAYRQANGRMHTRPTIGGSVRYTNMEEFFAVVISNVLISDPTYAAGNRTLRADHAGFNALAPALSTSQGFVSHTPNRNMMRELVQGDPALSKALAGVKSAFNPFAEAL